MEKENYHHYQKWCLENLVMQNEAREITGQSVSGLTSLFQTARLYPFLNLAKHE